MLRLRIEERECRKMTGVWENREDRQSNVDLRFMTRIINHVKEIEDDTLRTK